MHVSFFYQPFEHILIENFYTPEELNVVKNEIKFIMNSQHLSEADEKGATARKQDVVLASRNQLFVTDMFVRPEKALNLIRLGDKILDHSGVGKMGLLGKQLRRTTRENTLISFYKDGDYYLPHDDTCVTTQIVYLWDGEKDFEGGDLYFPEYNHTIQANDNQAIIFHSAQIHEVTRLKALGKTNNKFKRVSISTFRCIITT